jgi:hypothetical protein
VGTALRIEVLNGVLASAISSIHDHWQGTAAVHPYSLSEVARLTDTCPRKLRREVRAGLRDASKENGSWRFTWRHLAYIAMERWSLAEIHAALGDDAEAILPPPLTLRLVTVRLPEYVLRALETIASDEGKSLDDCLYGELTDFAGSVSTRVADRIPGYRRAYLFPGLEMVL